MSRPRIGITGPDRGQNLTKLCLWLGIAIHGGNPVRLRPSRAEPAVPLDGLLVAGGVDVDPLRYGQERKNNYKYDEPRDTMETAWLQKMLAAGKPVLGVCRGAQLLNVILGGTLYMDIRLVYDKARYPGGLISKIFARKWIYIVEGSRLETLLGGRRAKVNSLHRQSLNRIGAGLAVTAQEQNTIVQGVESTEAGRFILGVQWHPELMLHNARQRRIFRAFVDACRVQSLS